MLIFADQTVYLPFLSLAIGVVGLAGLIFTALRYRRDDTTALVQQQDTLFNDLKSLNEELRETTKAIQEERDELRLKIERLNEQIAELQKELNDAHAQLTGKMTRIERKLSDGDP